MKLEFKIEDEIIQYLFKQDAILKEIILQVGDYTLNLEDDYYLSLVSSIVSQQLSTKVATVIFERLKNLCKNIITPEKILSFEDMTLREIGLSGRKIEYLKSLSKVINDGSLDLENLDKLTDKEIIDELVKIKGIGKWTAQMFLMFSLGRLDVFPILDFGVKRSFGLIYKMDEPLDFKQVEKISNKWKPYRSVASFYLWEAFSRGVIK